MQFIDLKRQFRHREQAIMARLRGVLERTTFVMGPEVAELENRLADYVGRRHAVCVGSGTDALLIALMALDIGRGDEVITSSFSFIATAEVVSLLGATPVFCDIDPADYNIDAGRVEALITPRTRAILPVSMFGQCGDMAGLAAIAERHGLALIEDAAQSFGAIYHGRRSGAFGVVGCTSFYPSKPLGCYGDGGACFIDDDQLAIRCREIRDHGRSGTYLHTRLGLNSRLDTLQAAILLEKMAMFDDELAQRQAVAGRYSALLALRAPAVVTPCVAAGRTSSHAQYTVRVAARERVRAALEQAGIPTAVHYPLPLNRQPVFAGNAQEHGCPQADAACAEVLSLPMHPYLEPDELEQVVDALMQALAVVR